MKPWDSYFVVTDEDLKKVMVELKTLEATGYLPQGGIVQATYQRIKQDISIPLYQVCATFYRIAAFKWAELRVQVDDQAADAREALDKLTDEQRLDLFNDYCKHCGSNDPKCQCWNDE